MAAEAYANAVQFFENELSQDAQQCAWIRSYISIDDVRQVVTQAQKVYEAKWEKTLEARKWIRKFASSITQYGSVLDTVTQADLVLAGLAWGAIKFDFPV